MDGQWYWSVDPSPYVQNIGSELEIVGGQAINGLDGEFGDMGAISILPGLLIAGVLYFGYKYSKKKGII